MAMYRLLRGKHFKADGTVVRPDDADPTVELNDAQAKAFSDRFEKVSDAPVTKNPPQNQNPPQKAQAQAQDSNK